MDERRPGSPVFSRDGESLDLGRQRELDRAATDVSRAAPRWAGLSLEFRIALLDRLLADCGALAAEWAETGARGKKIIGNPDAVGQEWVSGPYVTLRYMRRLRDSLRQLETAGAIRLPGVFRRSLDGRAVVKALPHDIAGIYAILGNKKEALDWLQKAGPS